MGYLSMYFFVHTLLHIKKKLVCSFPFLLFTFSYLFVFACLSFFFRFFFVLFSCLKTFFFFVLVLECCSLLVSFYVSLFFENSVWFEHRFSHFFKKILLYMLSLSSSQKSKVFFFEKQCFFFLKKKNVPFVLSSFFQKKKKNRFLFVGPPKRVVFRCGLFLVFSILKKMQNKLFWLVFELSFLNHVFLYNFSWSPSQRVSFAMFSLPLYFLLSIIFPSVLSFLSPLVFLVSFIFYDYFTRLFWSFYYLYVSLCKTLCQKMYVLDGSKTIFFCLFSIKKKLRFLCFLFCWAFFYIDSCSMFFLSLCLEKMFSHFVSLFFFILLFNSDSLLDSILMYPKLKRLLLSWKNVGKTTFSVSDLLVKKTFVCEKSVLFFPYLLFLISSLFAF